MFLAVGLNVLRTRFVILTVQMAVTEHSYSYTYEYYMLRTVNDLSYLLNWSMLHYLDILVSYNFTY